MRWARSTLTSESTQRDRVENAVKELRKLQAWREARARVCSWVALKAPVHVSSTGLVSNTDSSMPDMAGAGRMIPACELQVPHVTLVLLRWQSRVVTLRVIA